jgi:O-antigen/teichoic acid export membrane protein
MTSAHRRSANRIFGSLGLVMGGKAGAGLISLGYLMIAAPYLGPRDFGILVLVHAYVVLVIGVFGFSAAQALVRFGAAARHEGDTPRLARLLRFVAMVEVGFGLTGLAVAVLCVPLAGRILGWPPEVAEIAVFYSVAVLSAVRSTPGGYLQLCGRFDLIGLHSMVMPLVRLVGAAIAAGFDLGLQAFLIAWMIAALAEWATMWAAGLWLAYRDLGRTLRDPGPGHAMRENEGIWRFTLANNADITLRDLAERAAPLIVGWIMGPAAAGLYSVAQRATVILAQPAMMLGSTAYAELARIVVDGRGGPVLRTTLVRVIALSLCAATPVVILLAIFSEEVVRLLAGPAFLASAGLMVWLVAAKAIALVTPPCSAALTAMGRPGLSLRTNLVASLIFIPVLPLLLHGFGLIGAGIGAVGQAMTAAIVMAVMTERISRRFAA